MKIKKLKLNDDGLPAKMAFEIEADEMAKVAYALGRISMKAAEELGIDRDCYDAMTRFHNSAERLFSAFYDDGVAEAAG